jgi:hypothetical protein
METKRLIPYSVHLPEDIHAKLKQAAGQRKASAMVRDAIIMIINETSSYNSGYNKGVRDCIATVRGDKTAWGVMINGSNIGAGLENKMEKLIIKEKANGQSKKRRGN